MEKRFLFLMLIVIGTFVLNLPQRNARANENSRTTEQCDPHFFDPDHLTKLLSTNKIETIADILKKTPNCYKENQVAIYSSSSAQCATPKAPRIILYLNESTEHPDTDAKSMCSFNSGNKADYAELYQKDPTLDCHENSMECQRFNPKTSRFEYYEVKVPKQDDGKTFAATKKDSITHAYVTKINPPQCMTSCHRANLQNPTDPNPRPNIENYPNWPGFYGSLHDHLGLSDVELKNYLEKFSDSKKTNPRYASLPEVLKIDSSGNPTYPGENSKPIVNLQNQLETENYKRIASEFLAPPETLKKIWPYRYALLASMACNDDVGHYSEQKGATVPPKYQFPIESFLPENVKNSFSKNYQAVASQVLVLHQHNIQTLEKLQDKSGAKALDQFAEQFKMDMANDPLKPYKEYRLDDQDDFSNISRLAYLGLNLGLPIEDWSMSFQKTVDFEAGRHNAREILANLAPKLLDPKSDADLKLDLDKGFGSEIDEKACELLRKKSLIALGADDSKTKVTANCSVVPDANTVLPPEAMDLKKTVSGLPQLTAPNTLDLCIKCHVNGTATPIPFDQPAALAVALKKDGLLQKITDYINSGEMPKNAILIQDKNSGKDEKADLIHYFKALSEVRE